MSFFLLKFSFVDWQLPLRSHVRNWPMGDEECFCSILRIPATSWRVFKKELDKTLAPIVFQVFLHKRTTLSIPFYCSTNEYVQKQCLLWKLMVKYRREHRSRQAFRHFVFLTSWRYSRRDVTFKLKPRLLTRKIDQLIAFLVILSFNRSLSLNIAYIGAVLEFPFRCVLIIWITPCLGKICWFV